MLLSLLPLEKITPNIHYSLSSLWFTVFKITLASFESLDVETGEQIKKPWLYAFEFRRDYYEKFFLQALQQVFL